MANRGSTDCKRNEKETKLPLPNDDAKWPSTYMCLSDEDGYLKNNFYVRKPVVYNLLKCSDLQLFSR